MATFPQEFIDLAAELIGDEFAAFASDCVVTKTSGFDPVTQLPAVTATTTIPMIRIDFKESSFNGQAILIGDYMLIGEYRLLSFVPTADNCKTLHDGIVCTIKQALVDPAKATIILHVRRA